MRIGVISDTHGLLRPEVLEVFRGVDHIIHAGDVGGDGILDALRELAPVTFVYGNNDDGSDGHGIAVANVGRLRIVVTHILPRPSAPGAHVARLVERERPDLVVFGHSHLPHDEWVGGVRYFNPASAGPRRFDYPVAVGLLESGRVRHVPLDARSEQALAKRMNQMR